MHTDKLFKYFWVFLFPGLTTLSFVITIVALGIGWDSYCEHNDSNAGPHAWLIVYTICCIPGFFLSWYGAMEVKGGDSGPAAGAAFVLFTIFIVGTFIWNMVGYGILFGSYKCIDNTLGIMMILNLAYQSSICLASFIRLLVSCCA